MSAILRGVAGLTARVKTRLSGAVRRGDVDEVNKICVEAGLTNVQRERAIQRARRSAEITALRGEISRREKARVAAVPAPNPHISTGFVQNILGLAVSLAVIRGITAALRSGDRRRINRATRDLPPAQRERLRREARTSGSSNPGHEVTNVQLRTPRGRPIRLVTRVRLGDKTVTFQEKLSTKEAIKQFDQVQDRATKREGIRGETKGRLNDPQLNAVIDEVVQKNRELASSIQRAGGNKIDFDRAREVIRFGARRPGNPSNNEGLGMEARLKADRERKRLEDAGPKERARAFEGKFVAEISTPGGSIARKFDSKSDARKFGEEAVGIARRQGGPSASFTVSPLTDRPFPERVVSATSRSLNFIRDQKPAERIKGAKQSGHKSGHLGDQRATMKRRVTSFKLKGSGLKSSMPIRFSRT